MLWQGERDALNVARADELLILKPWSNCGRGSATP